MKHINSSLKKPRSGGVFFCDKASPKKGCNVLRRCYNGIVKEQREIKFSYVTKRSLDKFNSTVDGKRVFRNGIGHFEDGKLRYVIHTNRKGNEVQYFVNSPHHEGYETKPVQVHSRCYGKWFFKTVGYYWEIA